MVFITEEQVNKLYEFFTRTMSKMNVADSGLDPQEIYNWNECGILIIQMKAEVGTTKIKAHYVVLSGQGNTQVMIVDEAGLKYIEEGGPVPENLIKPVSMKYGCSLEEAKRNLENRVILQHLGGNYTGSSADNDRALGMAGSSFGYEENHYYAWDLNIVEILAFADKHNLDLDPIPWEGYIY
jgi:hypothetical protein